MTPKRLIALIAFVVLSALLVGGVVFFWLPKGQEGDSATSTPFGQIGDRTFGTSTEEVLAQLPNDWLGDGAGEEVARLRRISVGPTVSGVPFLLGVGSSSEEYVRFTLRTNGDIKEAPLARIAEPSLVAQKTIVRIGAGVWDSLASSSVVSFLDTAGESVFSFLSTVKQNSASSTDPSDYTYAGRPLPNEIVSLAFSPDGTRMTYALKEGKGVGIYLEEVKTGTRKTLLSLPLHHVALRWDAPKSIILYPAPATEATGVVWRIDPDVGVPQVLVREKLGLSARTDRTGKKILFSYKEPSGAYTLQVADMDMKEVKLLPVPTITEKCAWGFGSFVYCALPRNLDAPFYLEGRFQGTILSNDVLWRFDTRSGEMKRLVDPQEDTKVPLDVVDIAVSPKEDFLTFRSFADGSLWAVSLPKEEQASSTVLSVASSTSPAR